MKSTTKILILALCFGAMSNVARAQQPKDGDYRTRRINPNNPCATPPSLPPVIDWLSGNLWQTYASNSWVDTPVPPGEGDNKITISCYTRVSISTIDPPIKVKNLVVEGELVVFKGCLYVLNGPNVYDLDIGYSPAKVVCYKGRIKSAGGAVINRGSFIEYDPPPQNPPPDCPDGGQNGIMSVGEFFVDINGELVLEHDGSQPSDWTYRYSDSGGYLRLNHTSGTVINANSTYWPDTNGPQYVSSRGPLTINVMRTLSGLSCSPTSPLILNAPLTFERSSIGFNTSA